MGLADGKGRGTAGHPGHLGVSTDKDLGFLVASLLGMTGYVGLGISVVATVTPAMAGAGAGPAIFLRASDEGLVVWPFDVLQSRDLGFLVASLLGMTGYVGLGMT